MSVAVKICGLTRPLDVDDAIEAGAAFLGLVFYERSKRALTPEQAGALARRADGRVPVVGVFVDPCDETIDAVLREVALDVLQLHGEETPERAQTLKARTGLSIIKALRIARVEDVAHERAFGTSADMLLFDARPLDAPGDLPGGTGLSFDWRLLDGVNPSLPWLLAGGLHPDNLERAVRLTGAHMLDVSTGVELEPGIKDTARVRSFIARAHALEAPALARPAFETRRMGSA